VLEAPALRRPRQWSLTLPDLSDGLALEGTGASPARRRRQGPPPPPPPPVGDTRPPRGFAVLIVVLLTLLLVASLLGGCLQVRSDLRFDGPGRLQLSHELRNPAGRVTPWQQRLQQALRQADLPFRPRNSPEGQRLTTPVLPASQALAALDGSLRAAAALADVDLPPAQLSLRETNWLVGVRQQLSLDLDLTPLDPWPSLDLELRLSPVHGRAVRLATPHQVAVLPAGKDREAAVRWPLQPGSRNRLELICWRWSPLGLGGLLILLGLALVLVLQRIRLRLGFGLPQLPA
jgi:hypothetical protein